MLIGKGVLSRLPSREVRLGGRKYGDRVKEHYQALRPLMAYCMLCVAAGCSESLPSKSAHYR